MRSGATCCGAIHFTIRIFRWAKISSLLLSRRGRPNRGRVLRLNCASLKSACVDMRKSMVEKMVAEDYAFHFDALPERVTFSKQIKITGWLLHRRGLPIHGIRGIVRGVLRRRSIFRARRKRSRPLIAAAYPDLPEAGQSGFLLVLELPVGAS